jgi:hypothetical protein
MVSRTVQTITKAELKSSQQAMTPITPLEPGGEMFQRAKTQSFFSSALTARSSLERPISHISVAYTDIEDDDSEFEEYCGSSVRVPDDCFIFRSTNKRDRATTDVVKQRFQHSKKSKHQVMRSDRSSRIGMFPKP